MKKLFQAEKHIQYFIHFLQKGIDNKKIVSSYYIDESECLLINFKKIEKILSKNNIKNINGLKTIFNCCEIYPELIQNTPKEYMSNEEQFYFLKKEKPFRFAVRNNKQKEDLIKEYSFKVYSIADINKKILKLKNCLVKHYPELSEN